ncbi:MAG: transglutaminase-like domain-containing protein [Clostridia bacterium]|nr:transglutaminase-like domain-containing protein [Clostridia bacterium]
MTNRRRNRIRLLCACMLCGLVCCACSRQTAVRLESVGVRPKVMTEALFNTAPGLSGKRTEFAEVDTSNVSEGYVMVRGEDAAGRKLKAQVKGPASTMTYPIDNGAWAALPLTEGDGNYRVTVLVNVADDRYAVLVSADAEVALRDAFAPFLHPNRYVNWQDAPETVKKAAELTRGANDTLTCVARVYDFVLGELRYDEALASNVQSGYVPDLDAALRNKKGICFDYAALMAGMLRSVGIPTKLIMGYAGTQYHAWIGVWTEEAGWLENVVYFDGKSWRRMDPTFADAGVPESFLNDDANYTEKYAF